MLLAKLATFPTVQREVTEAIVQALMSGAYLKEDLHAIARVPDRRILAWFEQHVDSPDRELRTLAKRVMTKGKKLPRQVDPSSTPPNRLAELFSTEVDLEDASKLLTQLARDLGLQLSTPLGKPTFLSALEIDQWVTVRTRTNDGEPVSVWFRIEDPTTVEVVVTRESPTTIQ